MVQKLQRFHTLYIPLLILMMHTGYMLKGNIYIPLFFCQLLLELSLFIKAIALLHVVQCTLGRDQVSEMVGSEHLGSIDFIITSIALSVLLVLKHSTK